MIVASFGFTTDLKEIVFDLKGYKATLNSFLKDQTEDAARSWLRTVLDIIPTWSKASRATFEALAKKVNFRVTYGPLIARKDRLSLGRSNSSGGTEFKGTSYHFFYETDLRYLEYNEFNSATPGAPPKPFGQLRNPTPYNFLEAGANDFESFAKNIQLPSVLPFISLRRI